ncbi:MAG: N-acetylneuraminate synthase family protein [Betaproteobacteria bacterium]|uniref:N-acetylneuraminate synthase family protein n=1 Tax=Candidatus Proximibacter danicus TaxID=2954365 RepID=A0A9D7K0M5_9PROT|nr:N-acetylneuraminate synthase family protein [Candidatus Proximibacter danicus]
MSDTQIIQREPQSRLLRLLFGADIIEKHITLDKDVPNAQDWKVSCDSSNFTIFINDVRTIEKARGVGPKVLGYAERQSILWARKSLTAAVDIPAGNPIER